MWLVPRLLQPIEKQPQTNHCQLATRDSQLAAPPNIAGLHSRLVRPARQGQGEKKVLPRPVEAEKIYIESNQLIKKFLSGSERGPNLADSARPRAHARPRRPRTPRTRRRARPRRPRNSKFANSTPPPLPPQPSSPPSKPLPTHKLPCGVATPWPIPATNVQRHRPAARALSPTR